MDGDYTLFICYYETQVRPFLTNLRLSNVQIYTGNVEEEEEESE